MNDDLSILITEYKNGNPECLLLIIERLKPAIIKYAKKLFLYDLEDSIAELELALLESVNRIPYARNDTQCLAFLVNALRNRYLELTRKSSRIFNAELPLEEQNLICPYWEYEYGNRELMLDLENLLSTCSPDHKEMLLAIFLRDKSCSGIAAEFHITRQYVTRIKKKWLKLIEKEIFTKEAI